MTTNKNEQLTEVILSVFKLNGELVTYGDKFAAEFGLTSALWKVLGAISLAETPLTMAQIARRMGLSRQALRRSVNELKKDEFLILKDNPDHKSAPLVALTPKGEQRYTAIRAKQQTWIGELSTSFSDTDIETTNKVLNTLSALL